MWSFPGHRRKGDVRKQKLVQLKIRRSAERVVKGNNESLDHHS